MNNITLRYSYALSLAWLLLCSLLVYPLYAQNSADTTTSPLEQHMLSSWQKTQQFPRTLLESLLIAEGVKDTATLAAYTTRIRAMERELQSVLDDNSPYDRAEELFEYLHRDMLKKYTTHASLRGTLDSNRFHCAPAVMLYYILGTAYHIPLMLYRTPTHIYCTLEYKGRTVKIELTDPEDGFDLDENIHEVIDQMVDYKLLTREEVEEAGYDRIYQEYFTIATRIAPETLVAVAYNNKAVEALGKERYSEAAKAYEAAMMIDTARVDYYPSYVATLSWWFAQLQEKKNFTAIESQLYRSAALLGSDSTIAKYIADNSAYIVDYYTQHSMEFERCNTMLDSLLQLLGSHESVREQLKGFKETTTYNYVVYANNKGEYLKAFTAMNQLLQTDTSYKARAQYIGIVNALAEQMFTHSQAEEAFTMLDSLIDRYPDFVNLRNTYTRAALSCVVQRGVLTTATPVDSELLEAKTILLRAYTHDSTNSFLKQGLALVHLFRGLIPLRERQYTEALALFREGLLYDPANRQLLETIDLTEAERKRPNRPIVVAPRRLDVSAVEAKVSFTSKIVGDKPFNKLSAIFLYEPKTHLYIEWSGLQKDETYKCEAKMLNSNGKELSSQTFYFTPSDSETVSALFFSNDKNYKQASLQFEIYLEGKKMFERTLRVVQ